MRRPPTTTRRRGVTILECVGSLVLLSVLLGLIAQMTIVIDRQAEARWQSRLASATLSNLMESAVATRWAGIESGPLDELLTSQLAEVPLPGADLAVDVTSSDASPREKQITLTLAWEDGASPRPRQLRLTTFAYADPEVSE